MFGNATRGAAISLVGALLLTVLTVISPSSASAVSGVVNTYQAATVVAGTPDSSGLNSNDCALVIQMTGTVANGLGVYEVLDPANSTPTRTYSTTEAVQFVILGGGCNTDLTVEAAGVNAAPWNGSTGGVVFLGGGALTLDGAVNATGAGFTPAFGPGAASDGTPGAYTAAGYGFGTDLFFYPDAAWGGGGGGGGIFGGGGGGGGINTPKFNSFNATAGTGGTATTAGAPGTGNGGPGGASGAVGNGASSAISVAPSGTDVNRVGAGGAGGGSYGGGGSSCGGHLSTAYASGGSGGGSWTGGGFAGRGGTNSGQDGTLPGDPGPNPDGNPGNAPLASAIPGEGTVAGQHFLHTDDPRLMMGGAGGHHMDGFGGGNGGGIIVLDFASIAGNGNTITTDGVAGVAPPGGPASGSGGGAGGQVLVRSVLNSNFDVTANGGLGGANTPGLTHTGSYGAPGGGGGIWFHGAGSHTSNTGPNNGATSSDAGITTPELSTVTWAVHGGNAALEPLGTVTVGSAVYTFDAWADLVNAAGAVSLNTPLWMGTAMVNTSGNAFTVAELEAAFPIYTQPNNPKNAGVGCMPGAAGNGLVRVSLQTPELVVEKATNGVDSDAAPGETLVVGQAVTWTYVVSVEGDGYVNNISLVDDQLGAITCPETSLDVGESMTCTATGVAALGAYVNVATVTGAGFNTDDEPSGPLTDTDPSHYTAVQPSIDIEKTTNGVQADSGANSNPQNVGYPIDWEFVVTNDGPTALANVAVTDVTDTANDQPGATGITCDWPNSTDGTTGLGDLSIGESVTCSASGIAGTGDHENTATAIGTPVVDNGSGTLVSVQDDNGDTVTVNSTDPSGYEGIPTYDLALANLLTDVSVDVSGTQLTYEITVKNQGQTASGSFDITDELPAGTSFVSASDGGTETAPSSGVVTWTIPASSQLAPMESVTVTLVVQVDDFAQAPYVNTAEVSADSAAATAAGADDDSTPDATLTGAGADNLVDITDVTDLDTDTNTDTPDEDDHDIAVWGPSYDLALANILSNVDSSGTATELTYEITVKNQGDFASGPFSITNELPAGTSFVSASDGGAETALNSGIVVWNIAAIDGVNPMGSKTVTLVVQVDDPAQAPFTDTAEISADAGNDDDSTPDATLTGAGADNLVDITDVTDLDTDTNSNTPDEDDHDIAVWAPSYDLALANLFGSFSPDGEEVTYEITVRNQGDLFSGSFQIADELATGTSFVSASDGGAETAPNSGIVHWTIPAVDELAPGESMTVTLVVQIDDPTDAPFTNTAEIMSDAGADDDSTPDATLTGVGADNLVDITDVTDLDTDTNSDTPDEDDHDIVVVDVPLYRVGNLVWLDANDNGVADDGEPGIGNVTVQLWEDGGLAALDSVPTDVNGKYMFDDLPAGDYYIVIPDGQTGQTINGQTVALEDMLGSSVVVNDPDAAGDADNDNNGFEGTGQFETGVISLGDPNQFVPVEPSNEVQRANGPLSLVDDDNDAVADNQSNYTLDIGFVQPLRVGNVVWLDNGGGFGTGGYVQADEDNGTADASEAGIAGVLVQLLDDNGVVIDETVTAGDGTYYFDGLRADTYQIGIPTDQTHGSLMVNAAALTDLRSSTGASTGASDLDDDDDGTPTAGWESLSQTFDLNYGAEATNEAGDFSSGAAGAAETAANTATGFVFDSNSNLEVDFGFIDVPGYRIGNLVWEDYNNNGVAEDGEPGIEGVLVQLLDDADVVLAETVTDSSGRYAFDNLAADDYRVRIPADQTPVLGLQPTIIAGVIDDLETSGTPVVDPDTGSDPDNDNNGVDESGSFVSGILTVGENDNHSEPTGETLRDDDPTTVEDNTMRDDRSNLAVDFGLFRGLRLGNQVFLDGQQGSPNYNNGAFDIGEIGIGGVRVELWIDEGTGTLEIADDTFVTATTTDTEGNYYFVDLDPGVRYLVAIEEVPSNEPGDLSSTGQSATPTTGDNDDDGDPVATYRSVSDVIILSADGATDSEADTVPGENAETEANAVGDFYPDANSELTVDFGFVDVPLYRVGNLVWEDLDNDGVAETGEPGIPGVLVQLIDDNDAVIGETATDATGRYTFENLAAADYSIRIPTDQTPIGAPPTGFIAGALDGYQSSSIGEEANPNVNADNNDNGVGLSDWESGTITLGETQSLPPAGDEPSNEQLRSNDSTDDDPDLGQPGNYPDSLSNLSVDFGFMRLSLGNQVFFDTNDNGTRDGPEAGIPGVEVELYDVSGVNPVLVDSTTTDGAGTYLFERLLPDTEYVVRIPASEFGTNEPLEDLYSTTDPVVGAVDPDGNEATPGDGVDGDDNGEDPASQGQTVETLPVVLYIGDEPTGESPDNGNAAVDANENLSVDFGFHNGLRIGSLVWLDDGNDTADDEDGIADLAEDGIEDVTVELWLDDGTTPGEYDAGDTFIESMDTDADGLVDFDHLPPGDYLLVVPESEFDAGQELASLVSTFDGADDDTTNNDDNGVLVPGVGLVSSPIDLDFGTQPDDELVNGPTGVVEEDGTYADTNSNYTVDFGLIEQPSYRIGNLVWDDLDADGIAEAGEPGIEDVLVQLLDEDGDPIAETLTDSTGFYAFDALPAGTYQVRIPTDQTPVVDTGLVPDPDALADVRSSEIDESDADGNVDNDDNGVGETDWTSGQVELGEDLLDGEPTDETVRRDDATDADDDFPVGQPDARSNYSVDFGFYRLSLGNQIFFDWNNSGDIDQPGEDGIEGVRVLLRDASDDSIVAIDTTDPDGLWLFVGLTDDTDYIVEIDASNFAAGGVLYGYHSSDGAAVGADPDTDTTDDDDNGGVVGNVVQSDPVTMSAGDEPVAESGVDNDLVTPDASENRAVDFGFYSLTIGNTVWLDSNDNGVIDVGEPGIPGVVVNLVDPSDDSIIDTVTTDPDGNYLFVGVPEGQYVVAIDESNFAPDPDGPGPLEAGSLNGLSSSPPEGDPDTVTDDEDDNGLNVDVPQTAPFDIVAGTAPVATGDVSNADPVVPLENQNLNVDFGFHGLSLGNLVFIDLDGNGVFDEATEAGRPDVVVELWATDVNGDPVGSSPLATQQTDDDGHYLFTDLEPGTYLVATPSSNFEPGGALYGYVSTIGNGVNAPDPDDDQTDGDDNGDPQPSGDTWSDPVTLVAAGEPAGETDVSDNPDHVDNTDDPNSNLTVDLGFEPRPGLALGNRVWHDLDANGRIDAHEPGIDGVRVELIDESTGDVVTFDITDNDGYYLFPGLDAGDYTVTVVADNFDETSDALWGYFALDNADVDPDDDVDNDDNGTVPAVPFESVDSEPVTLVDLFEPQGEPDIEPPGLNIPSDPNDNLTVDFAFVQVALGGTVFEDEAEDGAQDPTDVPLPGVVVNLLDENGDPVLNGAGEPISTTTDPDGTYLFDGLAPGTYIVEIPSDSFDDGEPLDEMSPTRGNIDPQTGLTPDPDADPTDADDNGDPIDPDVFAKSPVRSQPVTLEVGDEPTGETPDVGSPALPDENENLTVDIGFVKVPKHELGGIVWIDDDNSGEVDPGEERAPEGVTLTLRDENGEPALDDSGDPIVTATADDGSYVFEPIDRGTYIVEVDRSNVISGGPIEGFWPSTGPSVSADPNDDLTNIMDGTAQPDRGIRSGSVALYPETEPTNDPTEVNTPDDYSNLTVDFGVYTIEITGRVWFDLDDDGEIDPDETPGEGVVVALLHPDGTPVLDENGDPMVTTTDEDGIFHFPGVPEGSYIVSLPAENFGPEGPLNQFIGSKATDNDDFNADGDFISQPFDVVAGDTAGGDLEPMIDLGFKPGRLSQTIVQSPGGASGGTGGVLQSDPPADEAPLAHTGSSALPLVLVGFMLVMSGAGATWLSRRRLLLVGDLQK